MPELGRLNIEAAKQQPERHFESPMKIVDEIMLTTGEKLATLERWRVNIMQQLAAAGEGMRTQGTSAKNAEILQEIEEATKLLE